MPSNEGRGYVLHAKYSSLSRWSQTWSCQNACLDIPELVMKEMGDAIPVVVEKENFVLEVIDTEESRFKHSSVDSKSWKEAFNIFVH